MSQRRSFWEMWVMIALALALVSGCAHTELAPLRLRAGDFRPTTRLQPGQALILAFKSGERIPATIVVDGEVVETTPSPSVVWLTVKRDFWLRIRGSEIKTSLDGVHFDQKPAAPGHFQVAITATRDSGPKVSVSITTPVHGEP